MGFFFLVPSPSLLMFAVALVAEVWLGRLGGVVHAASWCIARSNVNEQMLQPALDYTCGAGADCAPIQPNGLCYLPNTVQAHASYAFNSYFQRKAMAPGTCDFGGTAVVAMSDPSYGSCVYPSSPSTAGGVTPTPPTFSSPYSPVTTTPTTMPTTTPPGLGGSVGGGVVGGYSPLGPDTDMSNSSLSSLPRSFSFIPPLLFSFLVLNPI